LTDERTHALYLREDGSLEDEWYIVYLNGATDGWPQAMFHDKPSAEAWVKTIRLNPEGFLIQPFKIMDLAREVINLEK
jgi:hypothetical protein